MTRKCSVVSDIRQMAPSALSRTPTLCGAAFVMLCPRRRQVIVVSFRRSCMRYLIFVDCKSECANCPKFHMEYSIEPTANPVRECRAKASKYSRELLLEIKLTD